MDQRINTLAKNLINYSTRIQKGEKILIEITGESAKKLGRACIKETQKAGGIPFVTLKDSSVMRELLLGATNEQIEKTAEFEMQRMKEMDAYIAIRGSENATELSDIPSEKMAIYMDKWFHPVHARQRVNNTKWVVLRYPNRSMAQLSNSSLEAFEDFYFDVCCLDYSKMSEKMNYLVKLMEKTDKVRVVGKGTDLTLSIKGIPAIKCAGLRNIPDGEVYTAPVKDSINGKITYNAPAVYQGFTYENICFEFKDGKIVRATANDTEKINQVLDTDEGARYIGEFAIGLNPYITKPMKDILFDEKIMGSIHLTPGQSYDQAPNGNNSAIHWDLVHIQTPEYGGGEIYFDDVLIRKDGSFVNDELKGLNPEKLK
ncbi:MAG: aminopeptidase [Myxococcota bacterium]